MNIYKSCELESTFIEMINPKKTNIIIGCIYRHPSMDLNEFSNIYLSKILDVSKENKTVLLLRDLISIYLNTRNTIPQMNFLIHSHQIFYILQESMVNQGLSSITYFPINIIKRQSLVT